MIQPRDTNDQVERFVEGVPKVELHSHLGGSVDAEVAFEYLKESSGVMYYNGYKFESAQQLDEFLRRPVGSLCEYLDKYNVTRAIFNDTANIDPLIDSMAGRYHAENTHILEIRSALKSLDTQSGAESFPSYSTEEEIQAYIDAIKNAREKYGMIINMILCIRRGKTDEHQRIAERTLAIAKECQKDGIVGIDLVGKEIENEAKPFDYIFKEAREHGLGTTLHAGEAVHEGSIKQAVIDCLVNRIGHGTSLKRHSNVYEIVRRNRIPLEICPTSNVECKALCHLDGNEEKITDLDNHPFPRFYSDGLVTTVNVDNLVVSNTCLTNELSLLNSEFNLQIPDITRIIRNSANASFSSSEQKTRFNQELDLWIDEFRARNVN